MSLLRPFALLAALPVLLAAAPAAAGGPPPSACATASRTTVSGPVSRTVCGSGENAVWLLDEPKSEDPRFAFGWRSTGGLPALDDDEALPEDATDVLVRLADGATVAVFEAWQWKTATARANHAFFETTWSKDRRWLCVVGSERYFADGLDFVRISPKGDRVVLGHLRTAVIGPIERDFAGRRIEGDYGPLSPEAMRIAADGRVEAEIRFWARVHGDPLYAYRVSFRLAETGDRLVARDLVFRWLGAVEE